VELTEAAMASRLLWLAFWLIVPGVGIGKTWDGWWNATPRVVFSLLAVAFFVPHLTCAVDLYLRLHTP
jgi:hypothetical protein